MKKLRVEFLLTDQSLFCIKQLIFIIVTSSQQKPSQWIVSVLLTFITFYRTASLLWRGISKILFSFGLRYKLSWNKLWVNPPNISDTTYQQVHQCDCCLKPSPESRLRQQIRLVQRSDSADEQTHKRPVCPPFNGLNGYMLLFDAPIL